MIKIDNYSDLTKKSEHYKIGNICVTDGKIKWFLETDTRIVFLISDQKLLNNIIKNININNKISNINDYYEERQKKYYYKNSKIYYAYYFANPGLDNESNTNYYELSGQRWIHNDSEKPIPIMKLKDDFKVYLFYKENDIIKKSKDKIHVPYFEKEDNKEKGYISFIVKDYEFKDIKFEPYTGNNIKEEVEKYENRKK